MIKFYSAWFCPYAQRAWLTLTYHNIPFEYVESLIVKKDQSEGNHGYDKNARLLELNPKGLVPTLELQDDIVDGLDDTMKKMLTKVGDAWVLSQSIECMVFSNSLAMTIESEEKNDIMPNSSAQFLADAHKFNEDICSHFYKVLMKPAREEQKEAFAAFAGGIVEFIQQVQTEGFYQLNEPTIVDFTVIPWLLRIPLLKHYRPMFKLEDYMSGDDATKLNNYISRMEGLESVKKTLWEHANDLIPIYERYADGSAQSQVGQAVKNGKNAHDC